jgi:hypothetical protein
MHAGTDDPSLDLAIVLGSEWQPGAYTLELHLREEESDAQAVMSRDSLSFLLVA